MTEMFGEAWSPMSVPDLAPDDDDDDVLCLLASSFSRSCSSFVSSNHGLHLNHFDRRDNFFFILFEASLFRKIPDLYVKETSKHRLFIIFLISWHKVHLINVSL